MFNQITIRTVPKYLFSSVAFNIAIPVCLLVNLFMSGLSPFFMGMREKGEYQNHVCECNATPHDIISCCCREKGNANTRDIQHRVYPQEVFAAFIESFACKDGLDVFAVETYSISLPEETMHLQDVFLFAYLKTVERVYPDSNRISPPDKPPRSV